MKTAICMATVVLLSVLTLATAAQEGFVSSFDGQTLKGWTLVDGKGPGYVVKDGLLVCPKDGGGNLFTEKEYSNFVFRFEFRTEPAGNNGVGIRAPLKGDAAYARMEIQILDHEAPHRSGLRSPPAGGRPIAAAVIDVNPG